MGRLEKTVDLGYERAYTVELPVDSGLAVGKIHGVGAREMQQDSFGISDTSLDRVKDKGILFVLADGMGGMNDGEKASMAVVVSCLNYFEQYRFEDDIQAELQEMLLGANQETLRVLGNSVGTGGSTAIIAYIKDGQLYWASVGDSHIYLYRNNRLYQLNKEHNYAAELAEMVKRGEISSEMAIAHPQRKALTSFIGIGELEKIDSNVDAISLKKGERVLLMSDGVFNTLSEKQIVEAMQYSVVKSAMSLGMQIEQIKKRGQDNYTALIVEIL